VLERSHTYIYSDLNAICCSLNLNAHKIANTYSSKHFLQDIFFLQKFHLRTASRYHFSVYACQRDIIFPFMLVNAISFFRLCMSMRYNFSVYISQDIFFLQNSIYVLRSYHRDIIFPFMYVNATSFFRIYMSLRSFFCLCTAVMSYH